MVIISLIIYDANKHKVQSIHGAMRNTIIPCDSMKTAKMVAKTLYDDNAYKYDVAENRMDEECRRGWKAHNWKENESFIKCSIIEPHTHTAEIANTIRVDFRKNTGINW